MRGPNFLEEPWGTEALQARPAEGPDAVQHGVVRARVDSPGAFPAKPRLEWKRSKHWNICEVVGGFAGQILRSRAQQDILYIVRYRECMQEVR